MLLTALRTEWLHLLNQAEQRIRHCVDQLSEPQVWWRPGPDQNSIGLLIQHLAGNLTQWVVCGIPQCPFDRDRAAEFADPDDRSVGPVLESLGQAVKAAAQVIRQLTIDDLLQPRQIQGFQTTVLGAVMHSVPHLVGHTHQIVQLSRQQLGAGYQFHWNPDAPRDEIPL